MALKEVLEYFEQDLDNIRHGALGAPGFGDIYIRRLCVGYDYLSHLWNSIKRIPLDELSKQESQFRIASLFVPVQPTFVAKNDIKLVDYVGRKSNGNLSPLDGYVTDLIGGEAFDFNKSRLVSCADFGAYFARQLTTDSSVTLDQVIFHLFRNRKGRPDCGSFKGMLHEVFNLGNSLTDFPGPAVRATDRISVNRLRGRTIETVLPYVRLDIERVTLDPKEQKTRTLQELRTLRGKNPGEFGGKPVRGVSWLIQPRRLKLFMEAGIEIDDVQLEYFQTDDILSGKPFTPKTEHLTLNDVLIAAQAGVILSPTNTRRYILKGELPEVGVVVIPNEVFFVGN